MSEQPEVTEEQVESAFDPDHPYVAASLVMDPEPTEVAIKIEPMLLEFQGTQMPAAQVTTVTPSGVQVVYLSPRQLAAVLVNGSEVLEQFRPKESGLVVADDETMKRTVAADQLLKGTKKP